MNKQNNVAFQEYLQTVFRPAQEWGLSKNGREWIKKHIPSLEKLILAHYDSLLFAVYAIIINGRVVYVGQSIRTVRRLLCHAYHLKYQPEFFGLTDNEVDNLNIEMKIVKPLIYNLDRRKEAELASIEELAPVLQYTGINSDMCILRRERREKMLEQILSNEFAWND